MTASMPPRRAAALVVSLVAAAALFAPGAESARPVEALTWQTSTLDLPLAWQVTSGSAATVVAVVDSGVQADNPALQGRVLAGYDFVNGDTNTADDNGHGTAVAGIIAAVCPDCSILPVKVLDANATGNWPAISTGIIWAADHGATVINLSVGAPRALDDVGAAIEHALSKGAIVVAAAGNDGEDETFYPAMYPGVISVAGVDQTGTRSAWSNFGSWVTVAAPGCATTAWLGGGGTSDFCGTSAAAPFVAGLAGLARAFDPSLDAGAFAAALRASGQSLPDPMTASAGLPDANRLLVALGAPVRTPTEGAPPTISPAPVVGRRCTAAVGKWSGTRSTTISWQRSRPGTGWTTVTSGATYTPRAGDAGYQLRVVVTAANARGSVTGTSQATLPVKAARAATARHRPGRVAAAVVRRAHDRPAGTADPSREPRRPPELSTSVSLPRN